MGCCESQLRQLVKAAKGGPDYDQYQAAERPQQHKIISSSHQTKRQRILRQFLQTQVNFQDDFLTHHLKYELSLTKLTSMKRIRRRQLVEHLWLQTLWGNIGGVNQLEISFLAYRESLISAWIQRTFLDIWQQAHQQLFVKHEEVKLVRRKIVEQYMFQIFEIKEYVDSGMSALNFMLQQTQSQLYSFAQSSDDALFNLFKRLKERYPQTAVTDKIDFPNIPTTTTTVDLLEHFPSKSFSDPTNMNYQTIYEDISFLLKRAIEEEEGFNTDMKDLLGDDALSCPKVRQVTSEGKTTFNACAVRRVFVKWAENLLEKCPDLKYTKTFMKFVRARAAIIDNFFFKSTIQPTTHKLVIDCLSLLIELAKYDLKNRTRRQEFTFNIYDLLRCKVKRNTAEEVVALLRRLESTSKTKSGKRFEVIRVKNRFQTNNRDLLVNFRYGDVLVGEAQLGVDTTNISKEAKLNHAISHFIYELERSIFGPTLEMMMQYEDFQRPDITVSFEAEGLALPRVSDEIIKNAGAISRKCLHGHDMISLVGNYFITPKSSELSEQQLIQAQIESVCNYCDKESTIQIPYDYCYQCGCYLCKDCNHAYTTADPQQFWCSIQRQDLLPTLTHHRQLQTLCAQNGSTIVLFCLEDSSASVLFRDCIVFHQSKLLMQPGKYVPKIAQVKHSYSVEYQGLAALYGLVEYPTLMLLNKQARPVRTVIGFSWFEAANLYMTQKLLIEGKSLDLDINCCACAQEMKLAPIKPDSVCLNCFGVSTPINIPSQLASYGAYCSQGHFRCMNCCYAALEFPSYYRDFMGGSYIATSFTAPKLQRCPRGHQTAISRKEPSESWTYTCFVCNCSRFFDNEHGVGQCAKCKVYQCPQCMGARIMNFRQQPTTEASMVRHFVQSTAQEACFCICQQPFKKVYSSRTLSPQELQISPNKTWNCYLCQRIKYQGQLHLACFSCPVVSKLQGKKFSLQICMRCANRAKMLLRQPETKVEEVPSILKCPRDGSALLYTSRIHKDKSIVSCDFCKQRYFGNSERFYCRSCDLNCCKDCRPNLWRSNPPTCLQRCPQSHQLSFTVLSPKSLQFCDGCMIVMQEEGFKCEEDCYVLCTNCVAKKPAGFVGDYAAIAKSPFEPNQSMAQETASYNYSEVFQGYFNEASNQLNPLREKLANAWDDFFG